MCLSDTRLEVVLDPLPDSVFIGFLGVIEIEMNVVFEKVDDTVAGLAFIISRIVRVADGIGGGLVREMW